MTTQVDSATPDSETGPETPEGSRRPFASMGERLRRRSWPAAVTAVSVVGGMAFCLLFTYRSAHVTCWRVPGDIWSAYRSAHVIGWGDLGGIYGAGTGLVTFPGLLLLLAPVALLTGALGLSESFPYTLPHPTAWLILGPYEIVLSSAALFALDALAERLAVPPRRRALLTVFEGAIVWNVDVIWGHPEDALAIALATYAVVCALDGRFVACGWLFGAAVATQPLTLLVLPVLLAIGSRREAPGLCVRSFLPATVLMVVPFVANFGDTKYAVFDQPNFPLIDHVTPWTSLAPHLSGKGMSSAVAAGPGRIVAVVLACAVGWWARRWRDDPARLVAAVAVCLSLRCLTESVMVPFYLWPPLAVGLVAAASRAPWRMWLSGALSIAVTYFSNRHGVPWALWWGLTTGGLVMVQLVAWPWFEDRSRWRRHVPVIASEYSPFLAGRPVQ